MEKLKAFLQKNIAGIPVWAIAIAIVIGLFIARKVLQEKEAPENGEEEIEVSEAEQDYLAEGLVDGTAFSDAPPPAPIPVEIRIDPTSPAIRKPCFYKWGIIFYAGDWDKLWVINRGKSRNQKISKTIGTGKKKRTVPMTQAEFAKRNPKIAACLKKTTVPAATETNQ